MNYTTLSFVLFSQIQSRAVLIGFISITRAQALKTAIETQEVQEWSERMKLWLKDLSVFQQSSLYNQRAADDLLAVQQLSDSDLPIWLAAQRAVTRYEGILSPVGPRGRLLRKLLSWIGLIPPTPETPYELDNDSNASESYKRFAPIKFLSSYIVAVVVFFI